MHRIPRKDKWIKKKGSKYEVKRWSVKQFFLKLMYTDNHKEYEGDH